MAPVIVHIGYPKTGTTTLQGHLFGSHPEVCSIGKPTMTAEGRRILECLTKPNVDANYVDATAAWWKGIQHTGRVTVLSHESLSQAAYHRSEFGMPIPERIARLFGQAKVMIGIRNQVGWLESYYLHHTRPSQYRSFPDFMREHRSHDTNYHRVAMMYVAQFGLENVGVFPVEELAIAPKDYMSRAAQFIGVTVRDLDLAPPRANSRKSRRLIWYARLRSLIPLPAMRNPPRHLVKMAEAFLSGGRPSSVNIPGDLRLEIEHLAAPSNAALSGAIRC
jgi:hypothetical protein